jgi:predicted  nucleic acid-binding Zn-ribbon protein
MENKKDEVQNLLAEISGLNNDLIELNDRLDYYRTQLNNAATEQLIVGITREIDNLEQQIQDKQSEIDAIHDRIEILESEIAEIGEAY